jgi:hypothetical protein
VWAIEAWIDVFDIFEQFFNGCVCGAGIILGDRKM